LLNVVANFICVFLVPRQMVAAGREVHSVNSRTQTPSSPADDVTCPN